jgi:glycosyltransferase involved in cell wall biosynthesis
MEIVALVSREGAATLDADSDGVERHIVRVGQGIAWELRGFARALNAVSADAGFTVREFVSRALCPVIMHVFEPPAYRVGRQAPGRGPRHRAKDRLLAASFGGSTRRAARVTAGSQTTADWMRSHCGVEASVIHAGIGPFFLELAEPAEAPSEPFFFHLATGDPRDNTELVLRAFQLVDTGLRLVLGGVPSSRRSSLERTVLDLAIGSRVDILGWLTDEELRDRYRSAVAFLHPSRYEGFGGYPALEAMGQQTAVIALGSPGSSEALRDGALYIDREDPAAMAETMRRLADDRTLAEDIGRRGRAIARGYTWERTSRALVDVVRGLGV